MCDAFLTAAPYYADYRPPYPTTVVEDVVDRFGVTESDRVLDVGCGTGRLAVAFAAYAGQVIGLDPNAAMLDRARRRAMATGVSDTEWIRGTDAALGGNGPVRLTVAGRAFHRFDQGAFLRRIYNATEPGGGVAMFGDTEWLTRGTAEWQQVVYNIASEYVDQLPARTGPVTHEETWADVLAASPFRDVTTRTYERSRAWTADEAAGYVLSLSYCSPRHVGDVESFKKSVRERLAAFGDGPYVERARYETTTARR